MIAGLQQEIAGSVDGGEKLARAEKDRESWLNAHNAKAAQLRAVGAALSFDPAVDRDLETCARRVYAERNDARYVARHARQTLDDLHIQIDENGVTGQSDGSIQAKINAVCAERDTLARWKHEALTVQSWWRDIDDFVRQHPETKLGSIVPHRALELLRERDEVVRLNVGHEAKIAELSARVVELATELAERGPAQ